MRNVARKARHFSSGSGVFGARTESAGRRRRTGGSTEAEPGTNYPLGTRISISPALSTSATPQATEGPLIQSFSFRPRSSMSRAGAYPRMAPRPEYSLAFGRRDSSTILAHLAFSAHSALRLCRSPGLSRRRPANHQAWRNCHWPSTQVFPGRRLPLYLGIIGFGPFLFRPAGHHNKLCHLLFIEQLLSFRTANRSAELSSSDKYSRGTMFGKSMRGS